jgi:RNAse (barnase) inhibitor barstar
MTVSGNGRRVWAGQGPGLYHAGPAEPATAVVARAASARLAAHLVGPAASKEQFLEQVAAALSFPPWFGRNLDALADCLGDLSWLPEAPLVLVWDDPDALARADPAAHADVVDVLRGAALESAGSTRPLTVVLAHR